MALLRKAGAPLSLRAAARPAIAARAMDAGRASHYVRGVELLLFLSAMLAGLLSGDRNAEMRPVEPTAVAAAAYQAAAPVVEAASEARATLALPELPRRAAALPRSAAPGIGPSDTARVDERRLE